MQKSTILITILVIALFILLVLDLAISQEASSTDYQFNLTTISSGGHMTSSADYNATITIAQPMIGNTSSVDYHMAVGFIYTLESDLEPPNIKLGVPANGSIVYTSVTYTTTTFQYNVSDDNIVYCELYVNDVNIATDSSPSTSATNSIVVSLTTADGIVPWYITCYDIFSNQNDSATQYINIQHYRPHPSGGISSTEPCEFNVSPKDIYFTQQRTTNRITIRNVGGQTAYVHLNVPPVPTVFGSKNLIKVDVNDFNLHGKSNQSINVIVEDISLIRQNTSLTVDVESSSGCKENFTVHLNEMPPIFYDVYVSTDKLLYSPGEIANITITLENKGKVPDRDSILKVYIIDEEGNKEYIYEKILIEVAVGITHISMAHFIEPNEPTGRYRVAAEYETETQGLLTAMNTFYVTHLTRNTILFLILLVALFFKFRGKLR